MQAQGGISVRAWGLENCRGTGSSNRPRPSFLANKDKAYFCFPKKSLDTARFNV